MEKITFANHTENENIKYGKDTATGKTLVFGFLMDHDDCEQRFAIHEDGRMMKTELRNRGEIWFNKPGTKWFPATTIPPEAQWIGQYVDDMF